MTNSAAIARRRFGRIAARVVLAVLSGVMLVPFLWMVVTAFRSEDDYRLNPGLVRVDWPGSPGRVVFERAYARDWDCAEIPLGRFATDRLGEVSGAPSERLAPKARARPDDAEGRAVDLSKAQGEVVIRFAYDPPVPARRLLDVTMWLRGDASGAEATFRLEGTRGSWISSRPLRLLRDRRLKLILSESSLPPAGVIGRAALRLVPEPGAPDVLDPGAIRSLEVRLRSVSRLSACLARMGENFRVALERMPFGRMYVNSLLVALSVTLLQVFTSSLAAFAFARLRFAFRDGFFLGYLATLMVPYHVTMIPSYLMISLFGWFDTYLALILPAAFSAYGTFLLRQFFLAIPRDLEDAARIDGCSSWGIYRHVVLPLSTPAIATLAIFTFLTTWQAFLWPLIVTQSETMLTLPVGLRKFDDVYGGPNAPLTMAAALVVMLPALIVFASCQRFYTKGLAAGGLKE